MTKARKYKLCGGTFFTLILNARKPRMGVREHYAGEKDGLSDPAVLLGLAKVMVPDFREPDESVLPTIKTATSKYKSCRAGCGVYFPFEEDSAVATFHNRIQNQYSSCLSAMCSFVSNFIDVGTSTKKDEYLIKALVEVMFSDDSIDAEQPFYILPNGQSVTKKAITSETTTFCLQSFLLGVFHYIVSKVKNNTDGVDTYNEWCPLQGGNSRAYKAAIGENSTRACTLTYCDTPPLGKFVDDDSEATTEIVTDDMPSETPHVSTQQILNTNPVINTFTFNGPVGTVYGHVDQVINNYGDKKDERK